MIAILELEKFVLQPKKLWRRHIKAQIHGDREPPIKRYFEVDLVVIIMLIVEDV